MPALSSHLAAFDGTAGKRRPDVEAGRNSFDDIPGKAYADWYWQMVELCYVDILKKPDASDVQQARKRIEGPGDTAADVIFFHASPLKTAIDILGDPRFPIGKKERDCFKRLLQSNPKPAFIPGQGIT